MQRQAEGAVQGESGGRMLSFRAVRVHDRHLQAGRVNQPSCGICSSGLEGAMAEAAWQPIVEAPVVTSDGGDEERDTASPPSDGPSGWEN